MIKENLNNYSLFAMKAGDKIKTEAFRAIKTAFMNWETAKENIGKTFDEQVEHDESLVSLDKKLVEIIERLHNSDEFRAKWRA